MILDHAIAQEWSNQIHEPDALLVNRKKFYDFLSSHRGYHPYINRTEKGYSWANMPIFLISEIEDFQFVYFTKESPCTYAYPINR